MIAERDAALEYWANRDVRAFSRERTWSQDLARRIVDAGPGRVLEFGCNVGRHLRAIHGLDPSIALTGVDINARAIAVAREKPGAVYHVGDESWLMDLPDDSFDLAFTVSVLDHLPDPQPALDELSRLASHLIFVEPWLGFEGAIVTDLEGRPANPFLYSWDYPRRLPTREWNVSPFPLSGWATGVLPEYRLHEARR